MRKADKRAGVLELLVLQVPAVGAAPSGIPDFVDDRVLPLLEIGGIAESFDELASVGLDNAKFESTSWHREDLALQKLSLPFEPPEHDGSP